jgi:hypothetical protein
MVTPPTEDRTAVAPALTGVTTTGAVVVAAGC